MIFHWVDFSFCKSTVYSLQNSRACLLGLRPKRGRKLKRICPLAVPAYFVHCLQPFSQSLLSYQGQRQQFQSSNHFILRLPFPEPSDYTDPTIHLITQSRIVFLPRSHGIHILHFLGYLDLLCSVR